MSFLQTFGKAAAGVALAAGMMTAVIPAYAQEYTKDNDYLKVYIWHLRRKLEKDPRDPKLLLTEWGIGYRLVP